MFLSLYYSSEYILFLFFSVLKRKALHFRSPLLVQVGHQQGKHLFLSGLTISNSCQKEEIQSTLPSKIGNMPIFIQKSHQIVITLMGKMAGGIHFNGRKTAKMSLSMMLGSAMITVPTMDSTPT